MWNVLSVSTKSNLLKKFNLFWTFIFEKLGVNFRWLIKKDILTPIKVSLTTTVKRENRGPVRESSVFFCQLLVILLIMCCWFRASFKNFWRIHRLGGTSVLCVLQPVTLCPHQDYEQVNFYKNRVPIFLVGPLETGKWQHIHYWLKIGTFQQKSDESSFFIHTLSHFKMLRKKRLKSRVCSRCKLWNYRFVQNQLHKVLDNLWRFMLRDLQFKSVCWYCLGRKTSTIEDYLHWAQLVSSNKLGRDVELKNTHSSLQVSRDVMQVSTLSAQGSLESELVDWYRDATSVPYSRLLVDLQTDDRLRYCTSARSIPSNFFNPDRMKQSKVLDDEHSNSFYTPSVPIVFPQTQKLFASVLPKRVYQVSLLKENLQKFTKHHLTKFKKRYSIALSKKSHLDTKKRLSGIRKGVTTHERQYSHRH